MNKYENEAIKQQIFFERYKNGEAEEIVSLLDKSSAEIASFVKATKGVYTKARYKEIAKKMREISASLKDKVGENIDVEGVIEYELKKQKKLLNAVKNDIVNSKDGSINFLYPTTEQIKTAALFKPVTEGMTYDSYLNGIEEGLYNTWDSAVRTGYLTGQPTSKIVSNVMGGISPETKLANPGLINSLRNSVYSNTKTLLQSFAAETRNRVFEENEKYFGDGKSEYKYEWLSTLDSHTCLVCGNLDGKLFKSIEDAPAIPVHRGCRCILLPYFNIEGDTRASKNGYVDSKITYSDWLAEQDEKTQKDVLGKTRYELFKKGERIEQFIDNGRAITLKKLGEKLELDTVGEVTSSNFVQLYDKLNDPELKSKEYFEKIARIEKELADVGVTAKLNGVHGRYADDIKEAITTLYNDYPKTKGCVNFVATTENMKLHFDEILGNRAKTEHFFNGYDLENEEKAPAQSYKFMHYTDKSRSVTTEYKIIEINDRFCKNYAHLKNTLEQQELHHSLAKGASNPKYLIDHELGHKIKDWFKIGNHEEDKDIVKLYNTFFSKKGAEKLVSKYAKESMSEFISECWASFRNSDDYNFTVAELCDILEKRYLK